MEEANKGAFESASNGQSTSYPRYFSGDTILARLSCIASSSLAANQMVTKQDLELIQLIDEPVQIVDAIFAFYEAMDTETVTEEPHHLL